MNIRMYLNVFLEQYTTNFIIYYFMFLIIYIQNHTVYDFLPNAYLWRTVSESKISENSVKILGFSS